MPPPPAHPARLLESMDNSCLVTVSDARQGRGTTGGEEGPTIGPLAYRVHLWITKSMTPTPVWSVLAPSAKSGARKEQEGGGSLGRSQYSGESLLGVLFATVRRAYAPVSLPERKAAGHDREEGRAEAERCSPEGRSRVATRLGKGMLSPGCDQGFGIGALDLCLAEQCSSLIRELYKVMGLCGSRGLLGLVGIGGVGSVEGQGMRPSLMDLGVSGYGRLGWYGKGGRLGLVPGGSAAER